MCLSFDIIDIYFSQIAYDIGLTFKQVTMLIDKIPIQIVHRTCFGSGFDLGIIETTFAVIRHIVDIIGTRDIRFGSEISPISKLRHTEYIWCHNSFKSIRIHLPKPLIDIMRIISHQESKVSDDHQSRDMITITRIFYRCKDMIDTIHLERSLFWSSKSGW